jgi:hypothetical protein
MLVINNINLSAFRVLMKRDVVFRIKNVAPATAAINYFNMLKKSFENAESPSSSYL